MPESFVEQVKGNALGIVQDEELKAVEVARLAQGAKEVLSVLKEGNIAIAIVSRNGIRCIQRCFSKFDLPNPDLIVAREATNELKPHPEHFRLALERLGVTPSEAVVIGDSHHDIDGGRKLGIETVLVAHGEDRMFERQAKPDLEIKRLSEILGLLF